MEDVNTTWLPFNHEFAIRRFCPERMEQEQREEELYDQEAELCSSDFTINPCLANSSEVDDFVESIINMDHHYDYDDDDDYHDHGEEQDQDSLEKHQSFEFDHSIIMMNDEDHIDAYSMVINDDDHVYGGYAPITMEDDEETEIMEQIMGCSYGAPPELVSTVEDPSGGIDRGLDLIHMLLACAEAVGCRDTQQAHFLLNRIWGVANPYGNSLERVSYYFATGLKRRLSLLPFNTTTQHTSFIMEDVPLITRENKLEAFQLLCQTTPYIALGFMAANETIYQKSVGKSSIHIIDLGMENTFQWPSLLRALVSRPEGPPRIRITGLIRAEDYTKLEASMSFLVEEAKSLGVALEFRLVSEALVLSLLTKEKLQLREGEVLFVNSILQLHTYVNESRGLLKEILLSIKKLGPCTFTIVEQDSNHNGPFFLGRFLESLHYYSAIFDSLEECMPRNSKQRMKVEGAYFAEEIHNIVAYEGPDRMERHERAEKWRRQLRRAGFQVMPLKCTSQARMLLSVYDCDGYTLSSEKGCLLLGWKGRPIIMVSSWQVTPL
ncbi:hypothetical protein PIB30_009657 [Stylosanthes scabra]|uniref:Uncharacterized protein n=1 Tax=Stylosanthes scabra TaxID=79078 RepID=A0ABU6T579_9FABA|nr:hypothetical protein [Stylosanthes scabra]